MIVFDIHIYIYIHKLGQQCIWGNSKGWATHTE